MSEKIQGYNDPEHEGNSAKYHTGEICITPGCRNPAGTAWSPFWCFQCNVKRIDRIGNNLEKLVAALGKEQKKREQENEYE